MAAWRDEQVIAESSDESLEDDSEWLDDSECSSKDETFGITSNNVWSVIELTDLYKEMEIERKKTFQRIFDKYENLKNQPCEDIHPHTFEICDKKSGRWRKLEPKDLSPKPLVNSKKNHKIIKKIAEERGMLNRKDTGNERSFVITDTGVSHCVPQESVSIRDESKGAEEPLVITLTNSLIFKSKSGRQQSLQSVPREASSASGKCSGTQSTARSGLLGTSLDESKGAEDPLVMTLTNSLICKSKSGRQQSLRSVPREASSASGECSGTQSTAGSSLLGMSLDESKGAEDPLVMTLTNSLICKSKSGRQQSLRSVPREASSASGECSRTQSTAGSGSLGKIGKLSSSPRQLGNSAQSRSEMNMSRSALPLPTLHGKLRGGKSEEYTPTDDSTNDHNNTLSRNPEISDEINSLGFICPLSSPSFRSNKNEHDEIKIHHVRRKIRRVVAKKLSNLKESKSISPNKLSTQKFAHRLESVDDPITNPNAHKNGVSDADYYKDYGLKDVCIKLKKIGISSPANSTNHGGVSMTGKATPERQSLTSLNLDAIASYCNFGNADNSTPGKKDNRRSVNWNKIKKMKKQSRSTVSWHKQGSIDNLSSHDLSKLSISERQFFK